MKEEDALLEAVYAAPDDDAPRLVYADFLQERGLPQGELIVVQCLRERLEREEKTTTLEYRQACWREQALRETLPGEYRRGFRSRHSMLAPSEERLASFSKQPWAPMYEAIVFRSADEIVLDAKRVWPIVPMLPKYEMLWPSEHGLPDPLLAPAVIGVRYATATERKIRDLIEQEPPSLRSVTCLNGLRFTGDAFDEYASTPAFQRLDHVELWRLEEYEADTYLTRAPPGAKHLTIVADDDVRTQFWMGAAFRSCRALGNVRELHVSVAYELEDVQRLCDEAQNLERWIAPDGIYDDAREAVAKGPLTKRLRHLEMSFGGYPDIADLVTAPWERLTSLALGNAWIGPELAKAPALETLVSLRLFGCKIAGDVEAAIRARWPRVRIE
jgi:uncharacterized protein (TIGR02996 family)